MWPGVTKRCLAYKNRYGSYYMYEEVKRHPFMCYTWKWKFPVPIQISPALEEDKKLEYMKKWSENVQIFLCVLWLDMSAWFYFQAVYFVFRGGGGENLLWYLFFCEFWALESVLEWCKTIKFFLCIRSYMNAWFNFQVISFISCEGGGWRCHKLLKKHFFCDLAPGICGRVMQKYQNFFLSVIWLYRSASFHFWVVSSILDRYREGGSQKLVPY